MSEINLELSFAPLAQEDVQLEVDYLRENAGSRVADHYIRSVNRTAALLLTAPYIGKMCGFRPAQFREIRRFPIHSPFQKRLLFYTPGAAGVRVERVLHGARNWAVFFQ